MSKLSLVCLAMLVFALTACGGGGSGGATASPAVNTAPVANAGVAQSGSVAATIALNGSASADANGDPLTYSWTLMTRPAGSAATLAGATTAAPTFTADIAGTYVASLVVSDGKTNSAASTVTVTAMVANATPVASAGVAQNVTTGTIVTLNGSASADANNDPLTYAWTLASRPAGSSAALARATSAAPSFTADAAGTYVASLVVNDGTVSSAASTVTTTATVANAAPVANAGIAQNVTTGTAVTLNGSSSTDANHDPLTYTWTLSSRPTGSSATLAGATSAAPSFTADAAGTYVASLVVNDGQVNSVASSVMVTAATPFPTVIAGNVYIQDFPFGPFNLVDLTTGALTQQTSVECGGLSATAVGPNGIALGTKSDGTVVQVDPVTGRCSTLFIAPEWLDSIAVATDGALVAQSQATFFGAKQIYRFTASGTQVSRVPLTGVGSLGGFSYASNGKIYGGGIAGFNDVRWYELNPTTGAATAVAAGNQLALSGVCINGSGIAYGHAFGTLYRYNAITGALLGSLILQRDLGLAPIICH